MRPSSYTRPRVFTWRMNTRKNRAVSGTEAEERVCWRKWSRMEGRSIPWGHRVTQVWHEAHSHTVRLWSTDVSPS